MKYAIIFDNGDGELWEMERLDDVEYLAYLVAAAKCTVVKSITLLGSHSDAIPDNVAGGL